MHNSNLKRMMSRSSAKIDLATVPVGKSTTKKQTRNAFPRNNRTFTLTMKLIAVYRVLENGEQKSKVGRHLGIPESTLRGWCKNRKKLEQQFNAECRMERNKNRPKDNISMTDTINETVVQMEVKPELDLLQLTRENFMSAPSSTQSSDSGRDQSTSQVSVTASVQYPAGFSTQESNLSPTRSAEQFSTTPPSDSKISSPPPAHSNARRTPANNTPPYSSPASSHVRVENDDDTPIVSKSSEQIESTALNLTIDKSSSQRSSTTSRSISHRSRISTKQVAPLFELRTLIEDPDISQFIAKSESTFCRDLRTAYYLSRCNN